MGKVVSFCQSLLFKEVDHSFKQSMHFVYNNNNNNTNNNNFPNIRLVYRQDVSVDNGSNITSTFNFIIFFFNKFLRFKVTTLNNNTQFGTRSRHFQLVLP